ncbi:hypothetical protein BBSC_2422 [Bifidobacterium scardovii JCM 12489 = DSM 13734]|nr:hypothetical protein BBSC_2422 [Bifidobacterium scardovii JCM 12489 = DSM 13734]
MCHHCPFLSALGHHQRHRHGGHSRQRPPAATYGQACAGSPHRATICDDYGDYR